MNVRKTFSLLLSALTAGTLALFLNSCVYAGNKSWDDMTPQEQAEVRQAYREIKDELDAAFPGRAPEDEWVQDILRRVEQAIPVLDGAVQNER